MKEKILISMLMALILTIALGELTSFASNGEKVRNETIRLHILANSDSNFVQNTKLKLKDEIMGKYGLIFSNAKSTRDAENMINEKINEIETFANIFLKENNINYSAKAYTTNMYFTTRHYDNFVLPAGNYDAIRIELGYGKGANWWCVMYPPMCIPAAIDKTNLTVEEIMKLDSNCKFIPKFKIIEIIEEIKENLKQNENDKKFLNIDFLTNLI